MAQINNDFWIKETGLTFGNFFNKKNSGMGHWGIGMDNQVANIVASSNAEALLGTIFTQQNIQSVTGNNDMNIFQFLTMVSIMLNETGGSFNLATGEDGTADYFFNYNSKIPKVSYNCSGTSPCSTLGNISAYNLFKSPTFMNIAARANMYKPRNPNDTAWDGYAYPTGEPKGIYKFGNGGKLCYVPCGIIAECDFFKFRGRGVIQLTGRSNYIKWLSYIQSNAGSIGANPGSMAIINSWGSNNIDTIATIITNTQLDTLFSDNACAILVFKTHNSNSILGKLYTVQTPNDFIKFVEEYGSRINGRNYGKLLANRIYEIIINIPDWPTQLTTTPTT